MAALMKVSVGKSFLQRSRYRTDLTRFVHDRFKKYIGDREIVGPGNYNHPSYIDNIQFPCPAIRFQRNSPYIQALREKEKCDWRNLTLEEKKCLYRASFCQTFAEMVAPTGEWKSIIGSTLLWTGAAVWVTIFVQAFVLCELPENTFDVESLRLRMRRMIDIENGFQNGPASLWDYENNKWKPGWEFCYPYFDPELDY